MTDELLTLDDVAALYRCTRRHARDVIVRAASARVVESGAQEAKPVSGEKL